MIVRRLIMAVRTSSNNDSGASGRYGNSHSIHVCPVSPWPLGSIPVLSQGNDGIASVQTGTGILTWP